MKLVLIWLWCLSIPEVVKGCSLCCVMAQRGKAVLLCWVSGFPRVLVPAQAKRLHGVMGCGGVLSTAPDGNPTGIFFICLPAPPGCPDRCTQKWNRRALALLASAFPGISAGFCRMLFSPLLYSLGPGNKWKRLCRLNWDKWGGSRHLHENTGKMLAVNSASTSLSGGQDLPLEKGCFCIHAIL